MIWFSLPHYGNKNMKTSARAPSFSLRSTVYYTVAALSAFSLQSSYATEFSQTPIVGINSSYPANVVLAQSVEYPTAGAAYEPSGTPTLNLDKFTKNNYIGYFDPAKCYSYNPSGYFEPVSNATSDGSCGGSTFSGKGLNWLTMSAIDIYRHAMTGGNRAWGTGQDNSAYQNGDSSSSTYLRRAYVDRNTNGQSSYGLRTRRLASDVYGKILPSIYKPAARTNYVEVTNNGFQMTIGGETFNVVTQVCKLGMLEANCTAYGNVYKPTGLMQENINKMRFSTLGYLNVASHDQNGGALRARMKSLLGEITDNGIQLGAEIDDYGRFVANPDTTDAADSGVTNSGVINYLNKFGDSGTYKQYDPAGELYYTGLRYLRKKNFEGIKSVYRNTGGPAALDNFPYITDWNDPLIKKGETVTSKAAMCRPNYMMYIGDINTWHDNSVPNFYSDSGNNRAPTDDGEVATRAALQAIVTAEGVNKSFSMGDTLGAENSRGSIAGLASWARTNDIRPDLDGRQFLRTIMIDTNEGGNFKSSGVGSQNRNSFYWAAKYGGFDSDKVEESGGIPAIRERGQWTSDAAGQTSLGAFADGVPKTYAVANNPDNMITALKKAFNAIQSVESPSQTAVGVSLNSGTVIDLSGNGTGKAMLFQSSYKKNSSGWQGDVIAYNVETNGFTEKWKLSNILWNAYRTNFSNRKVWTTGSGQVMQFNAGNATSLSSSLQLGVNSVTGNPANLINYVLGSGNNETGRSGETFRARPENSLLGTVVNSTVNVLTPPSAAPSQCANQTRLETLKKRQNVYAFAANDGMLHVVDSNGQEKFAYIPSTALPKLKDYAKASDEHIYINDGSPAVGEACVNDQQTSVIVGTTGRGGEAVYAIDASNIGNTDFTPANSNVLWEFTKQDDSDLGLTVHTPILGEVKGADNKLKSVAVVSSGYNTQSNNGYLYVLQIGKTGVWAQNNNYWKIRLGAAGVGAPKVIDTDKDGTIDRIYVGDEAGKLWRADYSNGTWSAKAIFSGSRPITGAPDAVQTGDHYTVIFNTGRYFDPIADGSTTQQNYAYGLFDKDGTAIAESALLNQSMGTTATASNSAGTYYEASKNQLSGSHKGWRLSLPQGFMSVDDAYIRRRKTAQFYIFSNQSSNTVNSNVCTTDGQTGVIEVDLRNGGLYPQKIFDTDRNEKYDDRDASASMLVSDGLGSLKRSNATVVAPETVDKLFSVDASGKLKEIDLNAFVIKKSIRRLSWRELF